jgi:hypothetical protein
MLSVLYDSLVRLSYRNREEEGTNSFPTYTGLAFPSYAVARWRIAEVGEEDGGLSFKEILRVDRCQCRSWRFDLRLDWRGRGGGGSDFDDDVGVAR